MKSIVLCGGGTAGHVLPAMALIPLLKKHFDNIVFIGGQGIEKDIAQSEKLQFYGVSCAKLCRSLTIKNAAIPFKLIKGIFQAKKILKKVKPNVVFSKGGYVALPTVIAAYLLKIPVVAHESDLSIGISNKICAPLCRAVCTSFESCANKLNNGIYTGSPLRAQLLNGDKTAVYKKYGIKGEKAVLLITGGSSGAKYLNEVVRQCIDGLIKRYYVIHITGCGNIANISKKDYIQIDFTQNIADIFAAADYIISRAGSNTLFEIVSLKKPSLIIPLPKGASRGDQIENAKYFSQKNCVLYAAQDKINKNTLINYLTELENKKEMLIKNMNTLNASKGNENIVNIILKQC